MMSQVSPRQIAIAIVFASSFAMGSVTANEAAVKTTPEVVDKDNDGVPDKRDKCPNTAQLKKVDPKSKYAVVYNPERLSSKPMSVPVDAEGCDRDTDGDGVVDHKDYCPEDTPKQLSAGIASNGCPKHSDKDGTPDYRDKCPNTPAGTKTDNTGCPV